MLVCWLVCSFFYLFFFLVGNTFFNGFGLKSKNLMDGASVFIIDLICYCVYINLEQFHYRHSFFLKEGIDTIYFLCVQVRVSTRNKPKDYSTESFLSLLFWTSSRKEKVSQFLKLVNKETRRGKDNFFSKKERMTLESDADVVFHKFKNIFYYFLLLKKNSKKKKKRRTTKDIHLWSLPDIFEVECDEKTQYRYGQVRIVTKNVGNKKASSETAQVSKIAPSSTTTRQIRYIAGMDITPINPHSNASIMEENAACAGLVICEYPSMDVVFQKTELVTLNQPYIAGFLAFREVPHLVHLINFVKRNHPQFIPD
ncbi:Endonuclease V family protein, partial [Reticulomyxa filosa]